MTNSSSDGRAAPPRPSAATPGAPRPAGSTYARVIPREELHSFEAWTPGSLQGGAAGDATAHGDVTPSAFSAAELEARLAAARQAGYHDGYRDGLVALEGFKQSYAAQLSTQFAHVVEHFDAETAALDRRLADAVATAAVQLARQVLRSELQTEPGLITRIAGEAVDAVVAAARRITVRLHPLDLALVTADIGAAATATEPMRARDARLVADESVQRGGCRVDSELGGVDAGIATRWAQASAALGVPLPWHDAEPAP
ncbi:MAG: FliH/SctL family protein [Rubrivivax sp.]